LGDGYWPVAGVDLMLLVAAGTAALAARRIQRRVRSTGPEPVNLEEPEHA
jgi:hypothetical protein